MGLGNSLVEAIVREHKYRPIRGDVVVIGRQTVYFTPKDILALLTQHGISVEGISPSSIELDRSTQDRLEGYANADLITDAALFRLLGVPKTLALDQSDYEGAEIIHDLSKPIPEELKNSADFIVDGSTLDNVFNPALALTNLADLLRPNGRMICTNVFSNHGAPYTILSPLWFLDYFVMNKFVDCKLYILVYDTSERAKKAGRTSSQNVFCFNLDQLQAAGPLVSVFSSPYVMATIVLAEKGANSTTDLSPVQQHYRSSADWAIYRENLAAMRGSRRPHLVRSMGDISFFEVLGGHLFVADDFTERDPMTEIRKVVPAVEEPDQR